MDIRTRMMAVGPVDTGDGWLWGKIDGWSHSDLEKISKRGDHLREKADQLKTLATRAAETKSADLRRRFIAESKELEKQLALHRRELKGTVKPLPSTVVTDFHSLPHTTEAAVGFIRKYGVFRKEDFDHHQWPTAVRDALLLSMKLPTGQVPFALRLQDMWAERDKLSLIFKLFGGLLRNSDESARLAQELAAKHGYRTPNDALNMLMSKGLRKAQIGLEFTGSEPTMFVQTSGVLSGIYGHLWSEFLDKSPRGECPRCQKSFRIQRRKQYCSSACEQAVKQRRYREKLASQHRRKSTERGRRS